MAPPHLRPDPVGVGLGGLPLLTAWEIAIGWPVGTLPVPQPPVTERDPVRALRAALRQALLQPPCVVAFSGGRDSSLLLSVAADLAAREGHRPPVALTLRYPGDAAADETAWQDLVVTHLHARGLRFDWLRHDVTDELDVVGPLAAPVLRANGAPTFPAAIAGTVLLAGYAAGGSLVTGNAGDEVLGGHRAAVLRSVLRRRGRGLTPADRRYALSCAAPYPVRRRMIRRITGDAHWLRPRWRAAAAADTLAFEADRPLRWDRSVRSALAPRAVSVGTQTRVRVAAGHACSLVEPLASAAFVAAYAAFGGRWGTLTRTGGTRLLADGLLPDAVVERRGKAVFNGSRFGPAAREFARSWAGHGVDATVVDPEALHAAWLADAPHAGTAMLLQQAWLACGKDGP